MTDAVSLIRAKRDGQRLADDDIRWLFEAYARHEVADEQMSALLMAIYFRGLDGAELRTWTAAMIASGDRLDLSSVGRPTVDKHSTGGVGDKVSLILAPLVAACGAAVPQLSGRGLGHTGGTLDKLESIPGFRTGLTPDETLAVLASAGCVICAAGSGLAPADRRLYALRDVTATVESIPLIASSIMSKKIAEGTSALVLDVKVGSGAFMTSYERARELAETMVALGEEHGVRTRALLTRMDVPLGRAVGNAVEVEESVQALQGHGPGDLMEVTLALARQMLALAGLDWRHSCRSRRGHRRRPGAGRLPGDGPRAGRRPGRPAAPGGAHPGAGGARLRLAHRPGRPGGRRRGLAPRRGPGAQGGRRQRVRWHHLPGQAGRGGAGGPAAARAPRRRAGALRPGPGRAGGRGRGQRPGPAAGDLPGHLRSRSRVAE